MRSTNIKKHRGMTLGGSRRAGDHQEKNGRNRADGQVEEAEGRWSEIEECRGLDGSSRKRSRKMM